jgi:malonyl-CoA O-methyltransferase
MPESAAGPSGIDRNSVRRSFDRAAAGYDAAAVLQQRVRGELLERLELVRLEPSLVVDLGAGTGHSSRELRRRYRAARVVALDLSEGMLREARRQQALLRRFDRVIADAAALPLGSGRAQLIFSNLMLHWCGTPDVVLQECRRVIAPGGLFSFTTLGPDTLMELRRAWHAADPAGQHVHNFIDMHDLGDALVRAGFAEPVLDVERYTLTYADVGSLLSDLRAIGGCNSADARPRGLGGRQALARMRLAYEAVRDLEGRLPASCEVVFGHAWVPLSDRTPRSGSGEARIPVTRIGRRGQGGSDP